MESDSIQVLSPPHVQAVVRLALHTSHVIAQLFRDASFTPELTERDQASLGVVIHHLDLHSKLRDVQPISHQQMDEWLQEYQFWKPKEYEEEEGTYGYGRREDLDTWWNAKMLFHSMESFIIHGDACEGQDGIADACTHWRREMCSPFAAQLRSRKLWYDVQFMLYEDEDSNNNKTPPVPAFGSIPSSIPHVIGFIYQSFEFDANLTFAELNFMSNLTKARLAAGALQFRYVVPVTLISFGGCNARVIHGHFDGQTGKVNLWMSKTISFAEPGGYRRDDWKDILCWALAEPRKARENVVHGVK